MTEGSWCSLQLLLKPKKIGFGSTSDLVHDSWHEIVATELSLVDQDFKTREKYRARNLMAFSS
jgi:hypothetical protein